MANAARLKHSWRKFPRNCNMYASVILQKYGEYIDISHVSDSIHKGFFIYTYPVSIQTDK
jgi:hypothetical protein